LLNQSAFKMHLAGMGHGLGVIAVQTLPTQGRANH
jgi:hypothetical protein